MTTASVNLRCEDPGENEDDEDDDDDFDGDEGDDDVDDDDEDEDDEEETWQVFAPGPLLSFPAKFAPRLDFRHCSA